MDLEAPPNPAPEDPLARPVPGIDNGFAADYRVRFDEAGPDGRIRASTLLRYAQDIAWRHSEALGFDRRWYADRGVTWVVRAVELVLHRPITLGQTLRASTAIIGHRRIWARRMCELGIAPGERSAVVTTDWVLLDGRNRVIRIPPDFGVAFPNPVIGAELLRVPPAAADLAGDSAGDSAAGPPLRLAVRPRDLDPMGHVNNAVYLDWAEEAVAAAGLDWVEDRARIRIEYLVPAGPGDEVAIDLQGSRAALAVTIRRADGSELARVRRDQAEPAVPPQP